MAPRRQVAGPPEIPTSRKFRSRGLNELGPCFSKERTADVINVSQRRNWRGDWGAGWLACFIAGIPVRTIARQHPVWCSGNESLPGDTGDPKSSKRQGHEESTKGPEDQDRAGRRTGRFLPLDSTELARFLSSGRNRRDTRSKKRSSQLPR